MTQTNNTAPMPAELEALIVQSTQGWEARNHAAEHFKAANPREKAPEYVPFPTRPLQMAEHTHGHIGACIREEDEANVNREPWITLMFTHEKQALTVALTPRQIEILIANLRTTADEYAQIVEHKVAHSVASKEWRERDEAYKSRMDAFGQQAERLWNRLKKTGKLRRPVEE
jgi:hypothetical protein